jgi:hypothetical protein
MTRWKYWIVANFYVTSFVTRPGRVFRILWNFLRGRETSKMESFLHETTRKVRRGRSRKRAEKERLAAQQASLAAGE